MSRLEVLPAQQRARNRCCWAGSETRDGALDRDTPRAARRLQSGRIMPLSFGLWAPVCGGWLRTVDAVARDASPRRIVPLARAADRLGYDLLYVPEHYLNAVYGPEHDVADAWIVSAAAVAVTERLRVITAVQPGFKHPGVVAKMGATLAAFRPDAFGLSLLAGWWRHEAESFGDRWLPHAERYARAGEYLDVIRGLWTEPRLDYAGRYFDVRRGSLEAKPARLPPILVAGESDAAIDLAARSADGLFVNGGAPETIAALVRRVKGIARERYRREIRVSLSAFALVRPTRAEAEEQVADLRARADVDTIAYFRSQMDGAVVAHNRGQLDDEIDANLGLTSGLVGDGRTVVERLRAFERAGVDTVIVKLQPTVDEVELFAREVIAPYAASTRARDTSLS